MPNRSTPAIMACQRAGVDFATLPYALDDRIANYGLAAADALGLDHNGVFKTLIAMVDDQPAVALVPVDSQCSLKALATACGAKRAVMADATVAERITGYVLGGISPLGQKQTLPTYIDVSASTHRRIYVSAGRRGLELGLSPLDLVTLTSATYAPIAVRPRR